MRRLLWLPLVAVLTAIPAPAGAVTIDQIVSLAHAGVTDAVILALIDRDRTIFPIEAGTTPGPLLLLPSHGILSANLTYEAPKNWTLEAYVTNIASKVYVANIVNAGLGPGGYVYDAPRQFGVRVGYRFDTAGN